MLQMTADHVEIYPKIRITHFHPEKMHISIKLRLLPIGSCIVILVSFAKCLINLEEQKYLSKNITTVLCSIYFVVIKATCF
jgi:hypothetical protein